MALTSLIDVIFILLLFFLLSSTFTRFGEFRIATSAPAAGAQGAEAAPVFLRLTAAGVTVNGTPRAPDAISASLEALAPASGTAPVLVAVDDTVTSQRLVDLLALLRPLSWAAVEVLE